MKTLNLYAAVILALAVVFASCSKEEIEAPIRTPDSGDVQGLSNFERDGLVALLETQKMHRDVYAWMNDQFPSAVFAALAESDGEGMERLSQAVNKYGIYNPTSNRLPGEFEDVGLQNRYNEFIRLTVGDLPAMIENARVMEEEVICQLQEQQLCLCGNDDLRELYGNLIQESKTQLQALAYETDGLIHVYAPKNEIRED